jgi:hypothetical protein
MVDEEKKRASLRIDGTGRGEKIKQWNIVIR